MGKTWNLLIWTPPKFWFFLLSKRISFPCDYKSVQSSVQPPHRRILRLISFGLYLYTGDLTVTIKILCVLLSSLTVPPIDALNPLRFLKYPLEYFTEFSAIALEEKVLKEAMTQCTFLTYSWKLPKQVTYTSKSIYYSTFNGISLNKQQIAVLYWYYKSL